MAFMKKDVNLGLLVLIIVSIILFSGFTVYYQTAFRDISLEYETKLGQLNDVTKQLTEKRQELNETYSLRLKVEQDKKTLDSRYKEVSDENEQLTRDNSNLRSEVSSTKSQLAEKTAELSATKSLLQTVENERATYKTQRDIYKSDLDKVCVAYAVLNNGVAHEEC